MKNLQLPNNLNTIKSRSGLLRSKYMSLHIFLALTISILASATYAGQPILVDPDTGQYLGNLNRNRLDPNSVSNPLGRYGNPLSPDSINNPLGKYGNPLSPSSPKNRLAPGYSPRYRR